MNKDDDETRRKQEAIDRQFREWQERERKKAVERDRKEAEATRSQYLHDKVHGGRAVHGRDSCLVTGVALCGLAWSVYKGVKGLLSL